MKLFGREPALYLATIGSVLAVLAAMNMPWLSAGQAAAIVAFLTALVMAITTRPAAPAIFTGALSAAVALVAEYGVHLSSTMVGALTGLVLSVCALLSRGQISPQETPVSNP